MKKLMLGLLVLVGIVGMIFLGINIFWYGFYAPTFRSQQKVNKWSEQEWEQKLKEQEQRQAEKQRKQYVIDEKKRANEWQEQIRRKEEEKERARVISILEPKIKEMLTTGAIHSVNVEFNQVRMDSLLWSRLSLESKQGFVITFSQYFEAKGSTGRVEVLSNRNDQKLATYSVWTGIKILQ